MPGALLDTHILLWWRADPKKLSKPQAKLLGELESRGEPASISAITLWELAKMVELGRLEIDQTLDLWLEEIENHPLLSVVPITAQIAAESVGLGAGFHKDPADQIIVATARCLNLRLLTADERIRDWGKVLLV
jgi:PIN domain nuclease of toxin-antitoxin system